MGPHRADPRQKVYVYAFRVPQAHGAVVIHRAPDQQIVVPYSGRIFVDPQTFSVLRITTTLDVPAGFYRPRRQND